MARIPRVSVIVPNYNHADFLEKRLASIFHQTFTDFEVILLDDASSDGSEGILERYRNHPKVSYFEVNKKNSGSPFKQWEKGMAHSRGEFIWIAESDDYCERNFLEALLPIFEEETVLVYCASNMVNEEGEVDGLDPWSSGSRNTRWLRSFTNSGEDEIRNFLRYSNTIPNASAVLFRRDVLQKVKIPVHMKFCGDWFFWISLLKKGRLGFCQLPLNYFRNHKNSTRVHGNKKTEKERFREFFFIITSNSSIIERVKEHRRYRWIIRDWQSKQYLFRSVSIFQVGMPLDFILRYFKERVVSFFNRKFRKRTLY